MTSPREREPINIDAFSYTHSQGELLKTLQDYQANLRTVPEPLRETTVSQSPVDDHLGLAVR